MTVAAGLPPQSHVLPIAERLAAGRALRDRCSRSAAGQYAIAAGRADPIDLLIANSAGRQEDLVPLRYGRMLASPFAFFRGAAAIMTHDLAAQPHTGLPLVICGDAHLMNFGGFATPERRLIFDINDFDEVSIAPWEWDVKRLAASFHIAALNNRFAASECAAAVAEVARAYRGNLARCTGISVLDAHYESIDLPALIEGSADDQAVKRYRKRVEKVAGRDAHDHVFAKLVCTRDGEPRIRDDPPLIFHPDDFAANARFRRDVEKMLASYRRNLAPERQLLLDRYTLADVAMKVVGVGSVGTRCGIALLISGNGDPLILQFKEARRSVLEDHAGTAPFKHAGDRVVFGQRLMQAASDIFLAAATGPGQRHYYLRQLRDAKISAVVTDYRPVNMQGYARACGEALARAHSRSGDATVLSGYLGTSTAFDDAMVKFARNYAAQNARDHAALQAAVRSGRLQATGDAA